MADSILDGVRLLDLAETRRTRWSSAVKNDQRRTFSSCFTARTREVRASFSIQGEKI
jgi:hypothetical protein